MRSTLKHAPLRFAAVAAAAAVGLGAATAPASAATLVTTNATLPFTVAGANNYFAFGSGLLYVECPTVTGLGTTFSPATDAATFRPTFAGGRNCKTISLPNEYRTRVVVNADWTLRAYPALGPIFGSTLTIPTVATGHSVVISVYNQVPSIAQPDPALLMGRIYLDGQTLGSDVSVSNNGGHLNWMVGEDDVRWSADGSIATMLGASSGIDGYYDTVGNNSLLGVNVVP